MIFRSPSTPETNRARNINIALLSSPDSISPPNPIGNSSNSSTSSINNYKNSTPCAEQIFNGFSLNSSPELPLALQNIFNQRNTKNYQLLNAEIDLHDTLESQGFVNINRTPGLSPAKKTKENEILQNQDLEVQFCCSRSFHRLIYSSNSTILSRINVENFSSFICLLKT